MVSRLRHLPGAQGCGISYKAPFAANGFAFSYEVAGRPPLEPGTEPSAQVRPATPGFFPALGVRLLRGRLFDEGDRAGRSQGLVVSEEFVRRTFPGEDPLGKTVQLGLGITDGAGGRLTARREVGRI